MRVVLVWVWCVYDGQHPPKKWKTARHFYFLPPPKTNDTIQHNTRVITHAHKPTNNYGRYDLRGAPLADCQTLEGALRPPVSRPAFRKALVAYGTCGRVYIYICAQKRK